MLLCLFSYLFPYLSFSLPLSPSLPYPSTLHLISSPNSFIPSTPSPLSLSLSLLHLPLSPPHSMSPSLSTPHSPFFLFLLSLPPLPLSPYFTIYVVDDFSLNIVGQDDVTFRCGRIFYVYRVPNLSANIFFVA
jgi:hypothetical protein